MMTFYTLIVEPVREMLLKVTSFVPTLVGVLAILIVGPIIGGLLSRGVHRLLKELKFDKIADQAGLSQIFHKGGMKCSASEGLSRLVYWVFVVIFVMVTVKAMGLAIVGDSVDKVLIYIPHVLSAVVIIVLGIILAKVIASLIHFAVTYMGLPNPKMLQRIARWAIVVYASVIALDELGLGFLLMGPNFQMIFGAVCFAFALAYGIGGKEAAAKYLEKYTKNKA